MELEKLQEKSTQESLLQIMKIDFLDIMKKEDIRSRRGYLEALGIKEITYEFSVDAMSFIHAISNLYKGVSIQAKKELDYFKVHFLQDDEHSSLSIGFSISSKENTNDNNDAFYAIDPESKELTKIDKPSFEKKAVYYKENLLKTIKKCTKTDKNTEAVIYKIKDVYLFLINHFILSEGYKSLFFQLIKFEEDAKDINNRNRLSLVVHAIKPDKDKGEGHDFGTVYP